MPRGLSVYRGVAAGEVRVRRVLTPDNFGIHYIRWPYDPSMTGANFNSPYPTRWQSELDGRVGWIRTFDPNLCGRYSGGAFTEDGTASDGHPYGRITGGAWYGGMLKSDGSYDWTKLDLVIGAAKLKGVKVLMNLGTGPYREHAGTRYIEYPLPTGEYWTINKVAWQARWIAFFDALLARAGNDIHAVELHNEPDYWIDRDKFVTPGQHAIQFAILCRLAKQLIAARGLSIQVLSRPFRETKEAFMRAFLDTSAVGESLFGLDGSGTTGRNWIDAVAHHNYGAYDKRADGGDTTAMDTAPPLDPACDAAFPGLVAFSDLHGKGISAIAAARASGWTGPVWNTEFHISGSNVTTGSAWWPRKYSATGYNRAMRIMILASVLAGYDKTMVYAADAHPLGFYDDNGTPPEAGQFAKSPDGTSRGAAAMAATLDEVIGAFAGGITASGEPFFSRNNGLNRIATAASNGLFL